MGTFYLQQLLADLDGNTVLATAAYNAGINRIKRWVPKEQAMDGDLWIETIPIKETREYVKNIMTYQAIYRHHLGKKPHLARSIDSIKPLRCCESL